MHIRCYGDDAENAGPWLLMLAMLHTMRSAVFRRSPTLIFVLQDNLHSDNDDDVSAVCEVATRSDITTARSPVGISAYANVVPLLSVGSYCPLCRCPYA